MITVTMIMIMILIMQYLCEAWCEGSCEVPGLLPGGRPRDFRSACWLGVAVPARLPAVRKACGRKASSSAPAEE